MKIKQVLAYGACSAILFVGGVAVGQQNIDPKIHPDLAHAQQLISQAMGATDQAQQAWGDKLGGHAARAKDLMLQADGELKKAAEFANQHR